MTAEPSAGDTAGRVATRRQLTELERGWSHSAPLIRRWLGEATSAMLGMAGVKPGAHVLDVAAGAGGQTLDIAQRVGPRGSVLATDIENARFDAVVCRMGLMLFLDPLQGLREMKR